VNGPLAWWRPGADDPAMFYVVAGCLGLCDAIWSTQTNSQSICAAGRAVSRAGCSWCEAWG